MIVDTSLAFDTDVFREDFVLENVPRILRIREGCVTAGAVTLLLSGITFEGPNSSAVSDDGEAVE